jgi:hypothetical protein
MTKPQKTHREAAAEIEERMREKYPATTRVGLIPRPGGGWKCILRYARTSRRRMIPPLSEAEAMLQEMQKTFEIVEG